VGNGTDNRERPATDRDPRGVVPGVLYIVSVPIGCPEDITLRALRILKEADAICCEDRRVAAPLLQSFGIDTCLLSLQERARQETLLQVMDGLRQGRRYAVISDCGTPLVADPGLSVIKAALSVDATVTAVPGASALLAAAAASGLPACPLYFAGFPPRAAADRAAFFTALAAQPGTLVLFETKKCLRDTMMCLCQELGETRKAAIGENLTTPVEHWNRGTLGTIRGHYNGKNRGAVQFVIVVSGIMDKLC
jgi:16S rRNA (cytidine1402-2'-O)-methyltransferase